MQVKLMRDMRCEGRMVAFIDNCIAVFPRNDPAAGALHQMVEVMITGVLFHKDAQGNNTDKPKMYFISKVTEEDILIRHEGFTRIRVNDEDTGVIANCIADKHYLVTPGVLPIIIADNRYINYTGYTVPRPGYVYIKKNSVVHKRSKLIVKAEGVRNVRDLAFYKNREEIAA